MLEGHIHYSALMMVSSTSSIADVCCWLDSVDFGAVKDAFAVEEVTGELLSNLTASMLVSIFHFEKLVDALKLMSLIHDDFHHLLGSTTATAKMKNGAAMKLLIGLIIHRSITSLDHLWRRIYADAVSYCWRVHI